MTQLVQVVTRQIWAISQAGMEEVLAVASREALYPEALQRARADQGSEPLKNSPQGEIRDGVAVVPIRGPMVRHGTLLQEVSGATSYAEIGKQLSAALVDSAVRAIVLQIDSPGGEANGVAELADRLREANAQKPVLAYVEGTGASAAYWLASAAKQIVVAETAWLGSIGVRLALLDDRSAQDKVGVHRVEIVSSQSPGKRATPIDDEVLARAQQQVDDLAHIFVKSIARNRGVSEEKVLNDFGGGDVLIGAKAVGAGLADRLGSLELVLAEARATTIPRVKNQERKMTEQKDLAARIAALRETDPDLAAHLEEQKAKRVAAEAQAEHIRYEDLIRAGKAEEGDHARKIIGPAAESLVRQEYRTSAELERYLRVAQPAPKLTVETPAPGGAPLTDHDQKFMKSLRSAGVSVSDKEFSQAKAKVEVR